MPGDPAPFRDHHAHKYMGEDGRMTEATSVAAAFERVVTKHEFRIRATRVVAVRDIGPLIRRVTLDGPELRDFVSVGPSDHVKVFFPDPQTGAVHTPTVLDGRLVRPTTGVPIARDFTPLPTVGDDGAPRVDLDFVLHDHHAGPARRWVESAKPGDPLTVGGPRGSRGFPAGVAQLTLVGDASSLPAISRWVTDAADGVVIRTILALDPQAIGDYRGLLEGAAMTSIWLDRSTPADFVAALDALDPVTPEGFVFAAGDAAAVAAVRRHLRDVLGLPAEQYAVSGYWKRGIEAFDHHAPLDDE